MSDYPVKCPKKLIEVALPLDAINEAAAKEKNNPFLKGHPRSIHTWWARRPLVAARAVLFSQLVNDPGYERHLGRGVNKERATLERERLFKIIERLVEWENNNNEDVLNEARNEILKSWRETCLLNKDHPLATELFNPETLPPFYDPFAGGGSIPLESQRLGLETYASDLNPVAVLINKAITEIPPRFTDRTPVGPIPKNERQGRLHDDWSSTRGLAEDVRRFGIWVNEEAYKRIGYLYPQIEITPEMVKARPDLTSHSGEKLPVIAWFWARTVKSPNPAFSHADVPLVSTFVLSKKPGKEACVEPIINGDQYRFAVKLGKATLTEAAEEGTKLGRTSFRCLLSNTPIPLDYIRSQAQAGLMGARLMAVVTDGRRSRVYLSPTEEMESVAATALPQWKPDVEFFKQALGFRIGNYGLSTWADLFTPRQLVALNTFCDLVTEARDLAKTLALANKMSDDGVGLEAGGHGATAYADAIACYMSIATSRWADFSNTICSWNQVNQNIRVLFSRQAIPIAWDYAELSPFSSVGPWLAAVESISDSLPSIPAPGKSSVAQLDAACLCPHSKACFSTDPPYYDNIGYADLSDFFYVWLRRSLKPVFPSLFATLAVPKTDELVATPARHGGKIAAEAFFLEGMTKVMAALYKHAHPALPITIYYAFKQAETVSFETTSTGWETFLDALLKAGFAVTGTWPMRTEKQGRTRDNSSNALASSIILVCRKRSTNAPSVSRREFIRELNEALPFALDDMTRGGVNSPLAPVDLSQAIIGPGMAIFSKYAAVLEADGKPMTVRTALQLINRFLAEDDFDHDTQFCLHWFENYGWSEGKFGEADVLARAKGTSVDGIKGSGVLASAKGVVQLLRWRDYPKDWTPESDHRTPIWEALHQMIRSLQQESEAVAGALLARMPTRAEPMRQLAYRLYTLCERKGWAEDARAYNELITSWNAIETASHEVGHVGKQTEMDV